MTEVTAALIAPILALLLLIMISQGLVYAGQKIIEFVWGLL
jgi:hypothetical protein